MCVFEKWGTAAAFFGVYWALVSRDCHALGAALRGAEYNTALLYTLRSLRCQIVIESCLDVPMRRVFQSHFEMLHICF